jgi:hypothetical protein
MARISAAARARWEAYRAEKGVIASNDGTTDPAPTVATVAGVGALENKAVTMALDNGERKIASAANG